MLKPPTLHLQEHGLTRRIPKPSVAVPLLRIVQPHPQSSVDVPSWVERGRLSERVSRARRICLSKHHVFHPVGYRGTKEPLDEQQRHKKTQGHHHRAAVD